MAVEEETEKRKKKGLLGVWESIFTGYNPADATDQTIGYENGGQRSFIYDSNAPDSQGKMSGGDINSMQREFTLPTDRFAKYQIFQDMARDPILSAALNMHLAYALSMDTKTGQIVTIEAKTPEFEKLADEVMKDLGRLINENITNWMRVSATYGVSYVRPYGEFDVGITDIEFNYYTLPNHIREYIRGSHVAGYTSEYLRDKRSNKDIRLAEPWTLVSFKIPHWQPDINTEPENRSGIKYTLFDDKHRQVPLETQNYGTSFFEFAYSPWMDLSDALRALKGSRYNASRIDRFITLGMENLDPVRAAQYLNSVGSQLRKDLEAEARQAQRTGTRPSVWNSLIPSLAGGKGGVTIDTQTVSPDISHIEDVMFRLKQVCSAMGIDPSMLGWGDLMSGGLGEGGFFRMSIQAALRANWLRIAGRMSIERLIEIHLAYKYGKSFPAGELPFEIKFHSLNTAIAIEENETMQGRAEMATAVATLLDMIENSPIGKSDTLKRFMLNDTLQLSDELTEKLLVELKPAAAEAAKQEGMLESVGYQGNKEDFGDYLANEIHSQLLTFLGEEK